ncbi:MAG: S-adenosylmethionine:tRNA ribosyltransferase-isomerase [Flammeovirgaceae bacterium]
MYFKMLKKITPKIPEILVNEFDYELPDEKIAKFPLPERDLSKLLVYRNGKIVHENFLNITQYLDSSYTLFFNNTKVIPARLYFQKDTGANIEILLLSPHFPTVLVHEAMQSKKTVTWECAIGNLKKWKEGQVLKSYFNSKENYFLTARIVDRKKQIVEFAWQPSENTFAEVLDKMGDIPLPPYLNRKSVEKDKETYQTIYGKKEGAVAAPTAGLHFTPRVFSELYAKNIHCEELTLHVSSGTFKPISVENVTLHEMHFEQVVITKQNVIKALEAEKIVAIGTTSMRTLESLYWFGVQLMEEKTTFQIESHYPYSFEKDGLPSRIESMRTVLDFMEKNQKEEIVGQTGIYIFPSYDFKMCDALITNFHQPKSTLLLLVAAFTKNDWNKIYQEAFSYGYRFLSYGDSSLLFKV